MPISHALSAQTLARVLDQSVDCVKLLDLEGAITWVNSNGLCVMEIDDPSIVYGQGWSTLWPAEAQQTIADALPAAALGDVVRFNAYCPTAKGNPRWWSVTVSPVSDVSGDHTGYLAISRDVTEAETARQASEIATAELRHRLKNTYAMIGSLIQGFARGDAEREAFAGELQARLIALSTAQALFVTNDVPCNVQQLVTALVEPFATPACAIAIEDFGALTLDQGEADALALAIGELAVNSSKHGALCHGGSIRLSPQQDAGHLAIVWTERSDVAPSAQERSGGQGLRLIDRIMRTRHGAVTITWTGNGLDVTLLFARL